MNESVDTLKTRFFADAQEYLSRAKEIVEGLADPSVQNSDAEEINELFRCVHSIKSEASYLKYETVGQLANSLEEKLEIIRDRGVGASLTDSDEIGGLLEKINDAVRADEYRRNSPSRAAGPVFNKFELKLLEEAVRRGERCYHVVFELEQDAPMKRARAFLILSNLEQISTVIRTEPSVSTPESVDTGATDEVSTYGLYLTAAVGQAEIYDALSVDQVARSWIDLVDFEAGEAGLEKGAGAGVGPTGGNAGLSPRDSASFYRLTGKKLDQLTAYADDLRLRLRELELDARGNRAVGGADLSRINHIAGGLYEELIRVRIASLEEEYPRYRETVRDLAERLGKSVKLKTEGGDLKLDRRSLAALSDALSHLLRNAVDHGIELPEKRRALGKDETGTVSIIARTQDNTIKVTVSDDGAGIDEEALRREVEKSGEAGGDLFGILSRPGFTTLSQATDFSGRGVGLDLVARRVGEVGGRITATAEPGRGISFEISVPKGPSYARLLFFRFGRELYAVPAQAVTEVRRIAKGELKRNSSGRVFHLNLPAYAGKSPARVGESNSYGSYALVLSYLGRQAGLLADDVLFEHEVSEEIFPRSDTGGTRSRRMAVSFGSEKREFTYLPPSMIHPDVA